MWDPELKAYFWIDTRCIPPALDPGLAVLGALPTRHLQDPAPSRHLMQTEAIMRVHTKHHTRVSPAN